jgi:hypothetical protein
MAIAGAFIVAQFSAVPEGDRGDQILARQFRHELPLREDEVDEAHDDTSVQRNRASNISREVRAITH